VTREQALKNMNLAPSSTREEIEKAYQRLVQRYPPEFHPERFRVIDESYHVLTSLAFFLERALSPEDHALDRDLFSFAPTVPETAQSDAVRRIKRRFLMDALWATGPSGKGSS
jgi:curved DNA-binding protein CbpA